jgi:tetratricopeptide (TPR) repeat protein
MRRIVIALIILAVLGLAAGGAFLYFRRDSGTKLLTRSELALRAQNYERAIDLAKRYVAENPEDWRGYYAQARGTAAFGRYEQARALLDQAAERAPKETDIVLLRADTYARPGREAATSRDAEVPTETLREGIAQLQKARQVLQEATPSDEEAKVQIDRALGMVLTELSTAQQRLSDRLRSEARTAKDAGDVEKAQATRKEAEALQAQADDDRDRASDLLLGVLRNAAGKTGDDVRVPTRAANALVAIVTTREREVQRKIDETRAEIFKVERDIQAKKEAVDRQSNAERKAERRKELDALQQKKSEVEAELKTLQDELKQARQDIDGLRTLVLEEMKENPPPLATTMLVQYDLQDIARDTMSADDEKKIRAHRKRLEAIVEAQPEHPETLRARLECAHLSYLLGEYDKTREICNAILEDIPGQHEARLYRALVKIESAAPEQDPQAARKTLEEAEQELFALKTDRPNSPYPHLYYARAALLTGKDELAREALRRVTELEKLGPGRFPQAHLRLGETLLDDGFAEEALAEAQTVLRNQPGHPAALRLFIDSALAMNEKSLVTETLRETAQKYPDKPAVLSSVVYGYLRMGNEDMAKQVAEKVVSTGGGSLEVRLQVAHALAMTARFAEAEAVLTELVEENPRAPAAHEALGIVYLGQGRHAQAIERFEAAVKYAPQNTGYRMRLARSLFRAGMYRDALDQVQAVQSRDPSHAEALLMERQIRMAMGEDVDVQGLIEAGLSDQQGVALALAYLNRGQPQKCADICSEILDKNEDDIRARWLLGRAHLAMNEPDACIEEWTQVLKLEPNALNHYNQLALALGRDKKPEDVEKALSAIPEARQDLIQLACAWLRQRRGQYAAAAEAYGRVADRPDTVAEVRTLARLEKGQCLAQAGHHDLAALEFERVPEESPLRMQAMLRKAAVLAAAEKPDESDAVMQDIRKTAVEKDDWRMLGRVGTLYLQTKRPAKALELADDAAKAAPANVEPLLLRASALVMLDRIDEAIQVFRDAVDLQPKHIGLHVRLIEALDRTMRRREALKALDRLQEQGKAARTTALLQRGVLMNRWGLRKQAIEAIEALADSDLIETPRVRMTLGRALAGLGRTEAAREQFTAIPTYAPQYLEAQQRLASLAETVEEKLAILREAEKEQPSPALTAQRISVLLDAEKEKEAGEVFRTYLQDQGEDDLPAPIVAVMGLRALLAAGDTAGAADLAVRFARAVPDAQWRHMAVLLAVHADPNKTPDLLPPVEEAGLLETLLGLYRAARQGGDVSPWAERVKTMQQQAAQADPPRAFPTRFGVLTAVAAGDTAHAEALIADAGEKVMIIPAVMKELVNAAKTDPAVRKEAVTLLAASIAMNLGLGNTGRGWAMEALQARPASQWAATLAARGGVNVDRLRAIVDLLKPTDCVPAQVLRMAILREEGKFEEAAEAAQALAEVWKDRPELLMDRAISIERAGRLKDALPLYIQVWETTKDPVAANNAAYLAAELNPDDPKRLAEALEWSKAAVERVPTAGSFRDTRGWIAYRLGEFEEARRELCQAVRRLPDAPEVHYHLGMAEQKTGDRQLARWHLEAAVSHAEAAKARDGELSKVEAEILRLAKAALADFERAAAP